MKRRMFESSRQPLRSRRKPRLRRKLRSCQVPPSVKMMTIQRRRWTICSPRPLDPRPLLRLHVLLALAVASAWAVAQVASVASSLVSAGMTVSHRQLAALEASQALVNSPIVSHRYVAVTLLRHLQQVALQQVLRELLRRVGHQPQSVQAPNQSRLTPT